MARPTFPAKVVPERIHITCRYLEKDQSFILKIITVVEQDEAVSNKCDERDRNEIEPHAKSAAGRQSQRECTGVKILMRIELVSHEIFLCGRSNGREARQ